jgi:hypothetical protein
MRHYLHLCTCQLKSKIADCIMLRASQFWVAAHANDCGCNPMWHHTVQNWIMLAGTLKQFSAPFFDGGWMECIAPKTSEWNNQSILSLFTYLCFGIEEFQKSVELGAKLVLLLIYSYHCLHIFSNCEVWANFWRLPPAPSFIGKGNNLVV